MIVKVVLEWRVILMIIDFAASGAVDKDDKCVSVANTSSLC